MSQNAVTCASVPPSVTVTFNRPLAGTTALYQKSRVVVVKPLHVFAGNVTPDEALVLLV